MANIRVSGIDEKTASALTADDKKRVALVEIDEDMPAEAVVNALERLAQSVRDMSGIAPNVECGPVVSIETFTYVDNAGNKHVCTQTHFQSPYCIDISCQPY